MDNESHQSKSLFSQLMAFCALPLIGVSVGIILIATLYPFTMQWDRLDSAAELFGVLKNFLRRSSGADDRINNVLLFMPLGFGLAAFVSSRQFRGRWFHALCACAALSLTVECLQASLPSRAPTAVDIITNTFGGTLGMLAFLLAQRLCTTRRRFAVAISLGIGLLLLLVVPLQRAARFSNWDYASSLTIGNELTDSEPWSGSIRTLALGATEVSAEQLVHLTANAASDTAQPWLARYDFTAPKPLVDKTQQQAALVPFKASQPVEMKNGAILADGQAFILSFDATTPLVTAIQRETKMTILFAIAPESLTQRGRIVSIAGDDGEHFNFDITQDEHDLIVRIRTPATGEHGTPALIAHDVFVDQQLHTIVVNYQRGTLRLAVDGVVRPETLEITPALAFFSLVLPFKANIALGRYEWIPVVYTIVYTGLVFIPWGLALTLWLQPLRSMQLRIAGALGTSVGAAALHGMLVVLSGGSWTSPITMLFQIAVASAATGLFSLIIAPPTERLIQAVPPQKVAQS